MLWIIILLMCAFPCICHAAGSCTQTPLAIRNSNIMTLTFACIGSSDDGSIPNITTSTINTAAIQGYYIDSICTVPGDPAPTNGYSMTLKNAAGLDLSGGVLASRSSSAPQCVTPKRDTEHTLYGGVIFTGALTLAASGQDVHSAVWTVVVQLTK